MGFIVNNWVWFLIAFYLAEKLVKLSATEYDDILIDCVFKAFGKIFGSIAAFFKKYTEKK